MTLFLGLCALALVMLFFLAPIAANLLHRHYRHHDHLIFGHPRSPR